MQQINTFLQHNKEKMNGQISQQIGQFKATLGHIGSSATEAMDRLETFACGGKGVRGGLFIFSADMFGTVDRTILLKIAAGLEILQASLLIHDDIMDNDLVRRGNPSLFAQYIENGENIHSKDPINYGKSMAICIGDIGFFIALEICNSVLKNGNYKDAALKLLHKELIIVSLAQMDDVTFAASKESPLHENILKMYLYKTAHYTFSLPLSLGAIITGQSPETIQTMETLGEQIGLLFQIKDDEIGIYGDPKSTGKPAGSDLRENKKTIIRALLQNKIDAAEHTFVENIYSNKQINKKDINVYMSLLDKYNIQKDIAKLTNAYEHSALEIIDSLTVDSNQKELLQELVSFVSNRTS